MGTRGNNTAAAGEVVVYEDGSVGASTLDMESLARGRLPLMMPGVGGALVQVHSRRPPPGVNDEGSSFVSASDVYIDDAVMRRYVICDICSGRANVFKAFERDRRRFVALKVSRGVFAGGRDARAARAVYREIVYLEHLTGHPNVARLRNSYCCENGVDVCLTFDFFEMDLKAAVVAGRLLPVHRTYVAVQLFLALEFVHSARVAHRDVEPSNVLIDEHCRVQLAGFASAKFLGQTDRSFTARHTGDRRRLTDDVGCLWYRPCEALLAADGAGGCAGDLWAAGCVLVEMETGVPCFPASTRLEVLARQLQMIGDPTPDDLDELLKGASPAEAALIQETVTEAVHLAATTLPPLTTTENLSPTFLALIEAVQQQREDLAARHRQRQHHRRGGPNLCAAIQAAAQETDSSDIRKAQAKRRGHCADVATLCTNIVPSNRGSATQILRHPLFDAFGKQVKERVLYKGGALYSQLTSQCHGRLDDGTAILDPAAYRDALLDYTLRKEGYESCRLPALKRPLTVDSMKPRSTLNSW